MFNFSIKLQGYYYYSSFTWYPFKIVYSGAKTQLNSHMGSDKLDKLPIGILWSIVGLEAQSRLQSQPPKKWCSLTAVHEQGAKCSESSAALKVRGWGAALQQVWRN